MDTFTEPAGSRSEISARDPVGRCFVHGLVRRKSLPVGLTVREKFPPKTGKTWSAMDMSDLRQAIERGYQFPVIARLLLRTEIEVRNKAADVWLRLPRSPASASAPQFTARRRSAIYGEAMNTIAKVTLIAVIVLFTVLLLWDLRMQ